MDIFSNLQVIGECLLDKKRVLAFKKAINEVVRPGDVVIDVGTGSGIMALLAARAGASKVYAIEIAEDIAKFARENIKSNKFNFIIEVVSSDIKNFNFPQRVNVITAELLDTCLVAEQQAQALNYLRKNNIIDGSTRLIPFRVDCAVEAVEYDFDFYGFNMPFIVQARNYGAYEHIKALLSDLSIFKSISFYSLIDTNVNETLSLKIKDRGILNAIRLKSKTYLSDSTIIWGTSDMNMPVIIPIEPIYVKKDQLVTIRIKYKMGEGFSNFTAQILRK